MRPRAASLPEQLPVLYQDEQIVVIDKPPNLLVHRSEIDRHETRFAVQLLRDQLGRHVHPVHRLDKGTSGVLLFALDSESASAVGRQFERDEVGKRYLAVVEGVPKTAKGTIRSYLDESNTMRVYSAPKSEDKIGRAHV